MTSSKFTPALFLALASCLLLFVCEASASSLCPQAALRSDAWVQGVVQTMNGIGLSDDRLAYLQKVVLNDTRAFSGEQITWLLPPLAFSETMKKAMGFLSPYIIGLNASEFVQILSTFGFSNDRMVILAGINNTLTNATDENKKYIVRSCFTMNSDLEKAWNLLVNVTSRDCVFGTVTALSATFVIDTSGSMATGFTLNQTSYTRLSYVQQHLSRVIADQLKPYQQFNVISFSSSVYSLFKAPVNATPENIKAAVAYVNRLGAGGYTNTYGALSTAFSSSPNTVAVYLLSDGLPEPVSQIPQILKALPEWNKARATNKQIKVYSTAFLLGNSSPTEKKESAAFMEQVASVTNGVFRNMDQKQ